MKFILATITLISFAHTLSDTHVKACIPIILGFRIPVSGDVSTVYTWFYVDNKYNGTTSYEKMDWDVHCSGRYCAQALMSDYKGGFLRARVKYEGRCITFEKEDKRTRQNDFDIFEYFGCVH